MDNKDAIINEMSNLVNIDNQIINIVTVYFSTENQSIDNFIEKYNKLVDKRASQAELIEYMARQSGYLTNQ